MLDDKKVEDLTHGHDIRSDHSHVLDYMKTHMSEKQVGDMVEHLKGHDSAHFMMNHGGIAKEYKLIKSNGHFRIHQI